MALTFLIGRRLRLFLHPPKPTLPVSIALLRHISATATASPPPSGESEPKLSLSARLSFVFDQIDALERQRDTSAKDEALQRIRSWRLSKHPPAPHSSTSTQASSAAANEESKNADSPKLSGADRPDVGGMAEFFQREVELVHPWPEWIDLMERLAGQNYFDYRRVEEDRVASNAGIDLSVVKEIGLDLTRDWTAVRTACMNFGRDRFDILKSLSRKDIQTLVGHGCPSMDPKVVFSAKLLRKYVHLDEGDVCSSCCLRNTCSRGYILVPKEDEARTLDVMRILLTYGFDYVKECVDNDILRKMKPVKAVVRKLLHEIVKLSGVPRDPNLLPPVIKKPPLKVKQPPPQPKRRVGRDDIEMKKGDWLCSKCNFMNFAKNTVCLQCDAKRPKRQLLPGEWECPKLAEYVMLSVRAYSPPDEFTENEMQRTRVGPSTRLQRAARAPDVSNAWNFDFDDDESDGADVAAFEFADSSRARTGSSLDELSRGGGTRDFGDDIARRQDRGRNFSNPVQGNHSSNSHTTGFDDFDDEEDDNVDSYELDESNGKETNTILRKSLSDFESGSESEDFGDRDRYGKSNQRRKDYISDSEDENIAVSAPKIDRSSRSSDSEPLLDFKHDMHRHYDLKGRKKGRQNAGQMGSARGRDSDLDDELDSDFDDDLYSNRGKNNGLKPPSERIGRNSRESYRVGSTNDGRNSFGSDDGRLYSRSSEKGSGGSSQSRGRRFQDSGQYGSKDMGKNSFGRHDVHKFDQGGSELRRRPRFNQSNDRASGFQNSRSGSKGNGYGRHHDDQGYRHSGRMTDHSKSNYRQRERNIPDYDQSRGFNDDTGFSDNNRRRRIIER
ncbi:hypothetical protein KSP40_PGU013751 [Platanthera guangdongensis]|uniref:RanBP2-type domain-containing protein n=1 Tax=Platanthera guangdongensis TaxID=2320717 RepID=A0ABR2MCL5_9ASPA